MTDDKQDDLATAQELLASIVRMGEYALRQEKRIEELEAEVGRLRGEWRWERD